MRSSFALVILLLVGCGDKEPISSHLHIPLLTPEFDSFHDLSHADSSEQHEN